MRNYYMAIEGVIGVGKTTLARLIQPRYNASLLLEVFEENPFLPYFYQDRERYAFQTQIFFLLSRYHQQHQAVPAALKQGSLVSDYTFAKDEFFAWLNLKEDELAMYGRVHAALGEKIPKPDLIIYLRAEHSVTMRRITLRDRPYERDMDPGYIQDLAAAYDAWLSNLHDTEVLAIDTTDLDFLARKDDLDHVCSLLDEALAQLPPVILPDQMGTSLLENGGLAGYQQFHRQLDRSKTFDPDLFFNYILLTEEVGEIARELVHIWRDGKSLIQEGFSETDAHQEAVGRHRATLRSELADLLAYTFKLANYTGIDLEKAYQDKMKQNIGREWPKA